MQYCSLQNQTLLSPPNTSTTDSQNFHFGQATSSFLELSVITFCSSPVIYWTSSDLGNNFLVSYLFAFSYCPWGSPGKKTDAAWHFLFQWATFCQNYSLWPVGLGWSCMACLIASLSYVSPFTILRLWSMSGSKSLVHFKFYYYFVCFFYYWFVGVPYPFCRLTLLRYMNCIWLFPILLVIFSLRWLFSLLRRSFFSFQYSHLCACMCTFGVISIKSLPKPK